MYVCTSNIVACNSGFENGTASMMTMVDSGDINLTNQRSYRGLDLMILRSLRRLVTEN